MLVDIWCKGFPESPPSSSLNSLVKLSLLPFVVFVSIIAEILFFTSTLTISGISLSLISGETFNKSILLLLFYSLGLAIPFIISGVLLNKFLLFSKSFRKNALIITKVGGIILLITGVAILTNHLQVLGFYILEYFPLLGKIG